MNEKMTKRYTQLQRALRKKTQVYLIKIQTEMNPFQGEMNSKQSGLVVRPHFCL